MSEPFKVISQKSGKPYYLHRLRRERNGKSYALNYFSGDPKGAEPSIPEGFHVTENPKTGLPFLKKNA